MMAKKHGFKIVVWGALFVAFIGHVVAQDVAVGHWRTHFASSEVRQLVQRDVDIFGLMETNLVYVDTRDDILYDMDRIDGLSGVGLSALAYEPLYDVLVVGYSNGLLDLVFGMDVVSLPYIQEADFDGDKAIYQIWTDGRYAYLATGFGVVVVDLRKEEIKETYFIGQNNARIRVSGICLDENNIFALTEEGLKYAEKDAFNLNDYGAWATDTMVVSEEDSRLAMAWDEVVLAQGNRVLAGYPGKTWKELVLGETSGIIAVHGQSDCLAVACRDSVYGSRVDVLGADRALEFSTAGVSLPGILSVLLDNQGGLWMGRENGQILRMRMNDRRFTRFYQDGPVSNNCFDLSKTGRALLVSGGGFGNSFQPSAVPFEVSAFNERDWTVYNTESIRNAGLPSTVRSVVQTVEDPRQEGHYFAATSAYGLVEIHPDGKMTDQEAYELIDFAAESRKRVKDQLYVIDETFKAEPARFKYINLKTGIEINVETLERVSNQITSPVCFASNEADENQTESDTQTVKEETNSYGQEIAVLRNETGKRPRIPILQEKSMTLRNYLLLT